MLTSKVFWTGVGSGALLIGTAFGAAWYAAGNPQCVITRAFDGACHASKQLSPVSGLGPVLARMQQAGALVKGETDLGAGLPDDPAPDGGAEPMPAPGTSIMSNTGDPAPIVIPENAPPMMPGVEEEQEPTLPMPRLLEEDGFEEEQEPAMSLAEMLRGLMLRLLMASPAAEVEPFPEVEMPTKPEMREDPHKDHHHNGCPAGGGRKYPGGLGQSEVLPSPALKTIRKIRSRETMDGGPAQGVETLELREADRLLYEYGPGAL